MATKNDDKLNGLSFAPNIEEKKIPHKDKAF